jgi:transcriptional regulator
MIVHGPHAYISPSWFGNTNLVPTWNYTAVHVYGTLKVKNNPERLHDIVKRYVDSCEAAMPTPWKHESAEDACVGQLAEAIVGFSITIDRIEGKAKLNHSAERQQNVVHGLIQHDWPGDVDGANLMQHTLDDNPELPA